MLQGREHWVPVKEDSDYEVSNYGNVRRIKDKRYLAQSANQSGRGYLRVALHGKKYYVHRLVMNAFFEGGIEGKDINHIDGNTHNNHITNLEICTRKENIQHAVEMGLFKHASRDYVLVTRCRDCLRKKTGQCPGHSPDFYCANGKRGVLTDHF